jgi:hypothetical protein
MKKTIIFIICATAIYALQWPFAFAKGYTVKNRSICTAIQAGTVPFKYTAGGIMRGEKSSGTLNTSWYIDGLKKGMLYSLKKNCFDVKV